MKSIIFIAVGFLLLLTSAAAQSKLSPTFEEVISLRQVRNPEISPNGQHILFQITSTDWENNRFDTEIWISKDGQTPFQLTHSPEGNSYHPRWSPNGEWIGFLAKRGEKTQIHVIRAEGGEAFPLSNTSHDISDFEWSPDGSQIAFRQPEDKSSSDKARKEKYGEFTVEDKEFEMSRLWILPFDPAALTRTILPAELKDSLKKLGPQPEMLLDSVDYTVGNFEWSPDGKRIAFQHQPDPLINSFFKSDISLLDLKTREVIPLVQNTSADAIVAWSPDGKAILYQTHLSDTLSNYYRNTNYFRIDVDGSGNKQLAKDFDENLYSLGWNEQGIFGVAYQKTLRHLYRIDPTTGAVAKILQTPPRIYDISFSKNGRRVAFTGEDDNSLTEVFIMDYPGKISKKLTDLTGQINDWKVAQSEIISWKSKDGQVIEGVLHKPQDYDPAKKYPLFVVIHGGPAGISLPDPTPAYVYPLLQWLNKGALVLRPNYRGSAGYGEAFRALNVENLGVGDAWDVLSGVESLENKGLIDGEKIAAMGWSQGGYISAFLATNSNKFKAISVGAGISNWMTYYVNTDIHPFTRQYLKATPWSNKAIYEKTSPMTNILQASTPTLIQHGEFDKRVPIANAYELFQGLQDVGVETKLIIYKGFGHGINKPKERLAAIWHNWQWFEKYIWGNEVEMPIK